MLIVLRLIHILAGAFWFGSIMFVARFVLPSLRAAGPAGGPVMNQLVQVRKMPVALMGAAILTILSGIWLMIRDAGGAPGAWIAGPGRVFGFGGACGIVAALLGMIFSSPAAKRIGMIQAAVAKRGGQPTAEEAAQLQGLESRVTRVTQIVAVLMVLAVASMAVARYV